MNEIKEQICRNVDAVVEDMFAISEWLKAHPETAYQEYEGAEYLAEFMKGKGFDVVKKAGDVDTAFKAVPTGQAVAKPAVAFLAEFDALPGIGHGCGHNLIAAASIGAALALKDVMGRLDGSMMLVGTPAEEGGGGKDFLAKAGVFEDADMAIMFHPGSMNIPGKGMLGRIKFQIEFFGRTAHAAGSPDKGINALDAMIAVYNNIGALRQKLRADARVHGVILEGGKAPNIIPDYTKALFYVRAASREYRDEIFAMVEKCIEAAALTTGCTHKIEVFEPTIDPMNRIPAMESAIGANMELLSVEIDPDDGRRGSSDIGNLSWVLPSAHPVLAIVDSSVAGHTVEFCEATTTEKGKQALVNAAKVLAMTAVDYLTTPELRDKVREQFSAAV